MGRQLNFSKASARSLASFARMMDRENTARLVELASSPRRPPTTNLEVRCVCGHGAVVTIARHAVSSARFRCSQCGKAMQMASGEQR